MFLPKIYCQNGRCRLIYYILIEHSGFIGTNTSQEIEALHNALEKLGLSATIGNDSQLELSSQGDKGTEDLVKKLLNDSTGEFIWLELLYYKISLVVCFFGEEVIVCIPTFFIRNFLLCTSTNDTEFIICTPTFGDKFIVCTPTLDSNLLF